MTKDSNTTVKGYENAVQSIGYAAALPAYPLNPPLEHTLADMQAARLLNRSLVGVNDRVKFLNDGCCLFRVFLS